MLVGLNGSGKKGALLFGEDIRLRDHHRVPNGRFLSS